MLLVSHCVWLFATPWTAARQVTPSFTISWSLLKFMSIELVMLLENQILYDMKVSFKNSYMPCLQETEWYENLKAYLLQYHVFNKSGQ